MLPVGWLVVAVVVAVLLSMWITFTLTRLDRLHARVDAARAALDAQLVRRAAALLQVAEAPETPLDGGERAGYAAVAQAALTPAGADLREAAARVQVARRFYNDAVRDTRTLRARRMPRLLRLAGHVQMPQFF